MNFCWYSFCCEIVLENGVLLGWKVLKKRIWRKAFFCFAKNGILER